MEVPLFDALIRAGAVLQEGLGGHMPPHRGRGAPRREILGIFVGTE